MANNRRGIYIRTRYYTIHIPIYDKVTVITGDSATGKTKLLNVLLACKGVSETNQDEVLESTINISDIVVVRNKDDLTSVLSQNLQKKYIFIDKMNLLYCDELDKFMDESKNIFVVNGHWDIAELTGQDAVLGLKHNGTDFECYKVYARGLLHPTDVL